MKEYTTKSTAQRAAAKEFGVKNSAAAVAEVAEVSEFMPGVWIYVATTEAAVKAVDEAVAAPVKAPKVKKAAPVRKAAGAKQTWKRPGEGTITGRVWELADKHLTRGKTIEAGIEEGITLGTLSQQYHRWNHQA